MIDKSWPNYQKAEIKVKVIHQSKSPGRATLRGGKWRRDKKQFHLDKRQATEEATPAAESVTEEAA